MTLLGSLTKAALLLALSSSCLFWQAEAQTVIQLTQFTNDNLSPTIAVGIDNDDDAVAVLQDHGTIFATFSEDRQAWEPLVPISNPAENSIVPDVAMDGTETALAIWIGQLAGTQFIRTSYFINRTWTTPIPDPLDTAISPISFLNTPSVAMNGTGQGLAAWAKGSTTTNEIHASFFNAGVWAPFQVIGTGNNNVKVDYLGTKAAAVWTNFPATGLSANAFNGTTWLAPTLLDNNASPIRLPDVGVDASGHAIAIWLANGATTIKVSRFDGTSWSANLPLSTNSNGTDPRIAVAADGTAIAVWADAPSVGQISFFDGTSWSTPVTFGNATQADITLDSEGNAMLGWTTDLNQLFTAFIPKGTTTIGTPVFIKTFPDLLTSLDLALSSGSELGAVVWNEKSSPEDLGNTFGTFVAFGPTPPTDIVGRVCVKDGPSHEDRVNIITWTPSSDPTVVSYNVRRNGVLVAIVPATGPFVFFDNNRCKKVPDTYTVTAVNAEGIESLPITVTIN